MEDDDQHWDEFKWEEFLKEDDKRADRLARIVEKYGDDPDLESILAHEMGWKGYPADFEGSNSANGDDTDIAAEDWKEAAGLGLSEAPDTADSKPAVTDQNPNEDSLYRKAYAFAVSSRAWLSQLPQGLRHDTDVVEILSHATIPAAKIVSAWDDDKDQDVLGFRIAVYKRGLAAANKALGSMNRLLGREVAEKDSLLQLVRQATEVRNGIAIRILEVREQTGRK